jgi:hypothetical protein
MGHVRFDHDLSHLRAHLRQGPLKLLAVHLLVLGIQQTQTHGHVCRGIPRFAYPGFEPANLAYKPWILIKTPGFAKPFDSFILSSRFERAQRLLLDLAGALLIGGRGSRPFRRGDQRAHKNT